jgi:hypothetical protein
MVYGGRSDQSSAPTWTRISALSAAAAQQPGSAGSLSYRSTSKVPVHRWLHPVMLGHWKAFLRLLPGKRVLRRKRVEGFVSARPLPPVRCRAVVTHLVMQLLDVKLHRQRSDAVSPVL